MSNICLFRTSEISFAGKISLRASTFSELSLYDKVELDQFPRFYASMLYRGSPATVSCANAGRAYMIDMELLERFRPLTKVQVIYRRGGGGWLDGPIVNKGC